MHACCGSLFKSNRRFSVVTRDPFGWVTDLVGVWFLSRVAGAPCFNKVMLAPVSIKVVALRLVG